MDKPAILTSAIRSEPETRSRDLLAAVNDASESAQGAWIVLLALIAYYFVALGGVSDRDLLLDAPIALPILNISVNLYRFFFFAPLIFIFIHFGVLVLHVVLARKAYALSSFLESQEIAETATTGKPAIHPLRYGVSSNFFTQFLAGQPESGLIRFFQQFMVWSTLFLLPAGVLLAFQIVFLPFHDLTATWLHRGYLAADIAMLALAGVFLPSAERHFWKALLDGLFRFPGFYLLTASAFAGFLFFAFAVATIPGEWLDRMLAIPGFRVAVPSADRDKPDEPPRLIFAPTALLFEAPLDESAGRLRSLFHRNLIVMDELFAGRDAAQQGAISLRYRDLRYARLDRSDLRQADLTCADLTGAVLTGTKLEGAKTGCPTKDEGPKISSP